MIILPQHVVSTWIQLEVSLLRETITLIILMNFISKYINLKQFNNPKPMSAKSNTLDQKYIP